jgi:hypothetical protein
MVCRIEKKEKKEKILDEDQQSKYIEKEQGQGI